MANMHATIDTSSQSIAIWYLTITSLTILTIMFSCTFPALPSPTSSSSSPPSASKLGWSQSMLDPANGEQSPVCQQRNHMSHMSPNRSFQQQRSSPPTCHQIRYVPSVKISHFCCLLANRKNVNYFRFFKISWGCRYALQWGTWLGDGWLEWMKI